MTLAPTQAFAYTSAQGCTLNITFNASPLNQQQVYTLTGNANASTGQAYQCSPNGDIQATPGATASGGGTGSPGDQIAGKYGTYVLSYDGNGNEAIKYTPTSAAPSGYTEAVPFYGDDGDITVYDDTANISFNVTASPPSAPTIGSATAGNGQASVGFTAPSSNGGAPITGYTATSNPGGFTGSCSTSPCTVTGLNNGTSYSFTVTATNSSGTSAASAASNSVVPSTVPQPPTSLNANPGNASAVITFSAPSNNGGSPITSYTATSSPGNVTGTCSSSPCVVTGLINGTAYTFTMTAANANGSSTSSSVSNSVTPQAGQTINFPQPSDQAFGTSTTLTATATSGLPVTFSSATPGVCTITSGGTLTTVTAGTCSINANQGGNASYSPAPQVNRQFVIDANPPGAPTIGTATPHDGGATVSFTPPASNGGDTITSYTVTSSPGGITGNCSNSPCTVSGLTDGTAYTFTVTATNAVGTGSPSAASNSVIPQAAQTITFANPGPQNFGTSPTLTATASSGLPVTFSSSTTGICTITSGGTLTTIATGTCSINANQAGNASYAAAPQVTQSFAIQGTISGPPTIGSATATGDGQATVTFSPPSVSGGTPITNYTATSSPGGLTGTCGASPCTVNGLTDGTAYTFTMTATDSAGTSAASAASNSVTPRASQTITFANPGTQNFGTTPTLTASASSGLSVIFSSSTTAVCTITTGGTLTTISAGTCSINANQAGNGTYNAAPQVTQSFTIAGTVPNAPTIGTASGNDGQATVNFTAPANTGGEPITGYTATSSPGGLTGTCAASPCTISGLTNGTAYTFTVTATNGAGIGAASAASNAVTPKASQTITFANPGPQNFGTTPTLTATATSGLPVSFTSSTPAVCTVTAGGVLTAVTPGNCTINANQTGNSAFLAAPQVSQTFSIAGVVPGAPTIGTATAGDDQATVTFTPPVITGGNPITGYTATSSPGNLTGTCAASPCTVTGLTDGTAYTFSVTATNAAGTGAASAASNSVTPKATGAITHFAANPAAPVYKPGGTFVVSATGTGSSSPLVFAIASGSNAVCSIQGSTVTTLSAGTCTVTANQAGDGSHVAAAQVTLAVTITNPPPPTVSDASATTGYNTATTVNLTSAISGIDVTAVAVAKAPTHGTATVSGQSITYTPSATFYGGTDSFTYTATNPGGTSNPATVTVTVTPQSVPVAAAHTLTTTTGTPVLINAETGATGPQPFVGVSVATQPAHGAATVSGDQISYTPAKGFVGSDSFTYSVANNFGSSTAATINVTVTAAGSAAGHTTTVVTAPGSAVSVNLASIVPGSYTGASLLALSPSGAGTASINQPTALTYTPSGSYTGLVQITAVLASASGSVTVDVLVLVTKQPDPSKNPDVLGIVNAQTNEAQMFAQGQLDNIRGRLESLHDGGSALFSNSLSLSLNGKPLSGGAGGSGYGQNVPGANQNGSMQGNAGWAQNPSFMRQGMGAADGMGGMGAATDAPTPATTSTLKGPQGLGVWIGGSANFGSFDAYRQSAGFDSNTIAVTMGVDQRIGNNALLGLSLGYNHDDSDISNDGTHNTAQGYSAALYGSFAPSAQTFVDAVLGGGGLSFQSQRYGENVGDYLSGHRNGDQWFAALTGGYEYKLSSWMLSPYGRMEWSLSHLNSYSETGDATEALAYGTELVRNFKTILGVRASTQIKESWGLLMPHFRLELGHDFQGATDTTLSYAMVPTAGSWNLLSNPYSANGNSVQVGFGLDAQLSGDWMFTSEYDYMTQPHAQDQMIKFGVKKKF